MTENVQVILVLDIGKTHVKLHVLDENLATLKETKMTNQIVLDGPYPHANEQHIWQWMCESLNAWAITSAITDIVVTTHGATAALIDCSKSPEQGLVLPILDYEFSGIDECLDSYATVRPCFDEILSPKLPAGLNLGKQLFWLHQTFPEKFSEVTHILMYPQYWAWRLTGQFSNEISSLGCHTDLWAHQQNDYSTLVDKMNWRPLLGKLSSAWCNLGEVKPLVVAQTGLSSTCCVYTGVHDSNASYIRYLLNSGNQPFTVISTGTWTIMMVSKSDAKLDSEKDMLANLDVTGQSVSCARFMGGREYERICQQLGNNVSQDDSCEAVQHVISNKLFVTPDFSDGNGPFAGATPQIHTQVPTQYAHVIATLYCALMIDHQLSMLSSPGAIFIEGAFLQNEIMCQVLGQLRSGQRIYLSKDKTGTVQGAAMLSQWQKYQHELKTVSCEPSSFEGLSAYKQHWLDSIVD